MKIILFFFLILNALSFKRYEDIYNEKKKNLKFNRFIAEPYEYYDMYLFALNWGSTLCLTGGNECYDKLKVVPKHEISIHGLWPNLKSGSSIPDCNTGSEIEVIDDGSETFLKMRNYWPTLVTNNQYFWGHEYNKHGYCLNKRLEYDVNKPELYFKKGLDVFFENNLNNLIIDMFGDHEGEFSVTNKELKDALNKRIGNNTYSLHCKTINKKKYLNEIRIKIGLDFKITTEGRATATCSKKDKEIIYMDFWTPSN